MSKRNITVMPGTQEILSQMGEQIKLARLRRELPAELVAERLPWQSVPMRQFYTR